MNIIEKIKNIFRMRKTKALPAAKEQIDKKGQFLEEIKVSDEQQQEQVNNKYLEGSLQQFFNQYEQILYENQYTFEPNFYRILVSINALGGDCNANAIHENNLMNLIGSSDRYYLQRQYNQNTGKTDFYHIKTKDHVMPSFDNMTRLYINCRNENTAELAYWLAYCNNNPQFYFKVDTNEVMMNHSRSEKIVIYTSNEQVEYCMQLINHIKTYRPDLFVDSEKTNPFMQSVDGIAYAKQPTSGNFKRLDGNTEPIGMSANAYIARIIKESYMQAAREIAEVDPQLQFLLSPEYYNDEKLYLRNHRYINAHYHTFLVNSMEQKMKYLCMENGIEIKGINSMQRQQQEEYVQ